VQTALSLVMGVADALTAIHAAGIVHRDLKPSNVLLASDGPRVIDFGIARAVEASVVTRAGTTVGSPQYMAPEQARGDAVTAASDVWALGALACFAATARAPFGEGGGEAAVLYRVAHGDPDLSGCPAELTGIISACLAKDPSARPSLAQVTQWCRAEVSATAAASARVWLPPVLAAGLAGYAVPAPATAADNMPAGANPPLASTVPPDTVPPDTVPPDTVPPDTVPPDTVPPSTVPPSTVPTVITHAAPAAAGGGPARPGWHGFSRWTLIAAGTAVAVLVGLAAYGVMALVSNGRTNHISLPRPSHSTSPTAAASKGPTPSPSPTLDSCLFGTWKQTLEQFPGTINGNTVTYSGGSGVIQTFTSAGVNTLTYNNATYTAQEGGNTWTEVENGTATVDYTTQDGMLLSSDLVQSGSWTVYEDGSVNNSGPLSENIEPDSYTCSGNSLRLFATNGDSIDLTRTS
jgi:hypothetical protein